MARPRKTSVVLRSVQECEDTMRRLKEATVERERLEAERDKRVADLVASYTKDITDQKDVEADLTLQLQNYYLAHTNELETDGRKSYKLTHGVMGRRLGKAALRLLNKAWTWAAVITKLREKHGMKYIRTADPEVDKEAVKKAKLSAEALKECGLKIEQDEEFYVEIDRPPATGAAA